MVIGYLVPEKKFFKGFYHIRPWQPSYLCAYFWDHWVHPGYFENRIPLKLALSGVCVCVWGGGGREMGQGAYVASQTTVLHMRNSVKPCLQFSCLCVLCFQRQSLLIFDKLLFPYPMGAQYIIWFQMVQWFQRRCRLEMLSTLTLTTDDGLLLIL